MDLARPNLRQAVDRNDIALLCIFQRKCNAYGMQFEDGNTPLHVAVQAEKSDLARTLVEECRADNASINDVIAVNDKGQTPLHCAASRGNAALARYLLQVGADFRAQDKLGSTPLHFAALHDDIQLLYLLAHASNVNVQDVEGCTPLHIATLIGHVAMVEYLIVTCHADSSLRDDRERTVAHYAAKYGFIDIINVFKKCGVPCDLKDNEGRTPLHLAAEEGHHLVVAALADKKSTAALDNSRWTALHYASSKGFREVVEKLISAGAGVQIETLEKKTPLMLAAQGGHIETASLLAKKSANLSLQDYEGCTALHLAAKKGSEDIVGTLLQLGADPNAVDSRQATPLHYAASADCDSSKIPQCLLDKGAKVNAIDERGRTPFHVAAEYKRMKFLNTLYLHGAIVNEWVTAKRLALLLGHNNPLSLFRSPSVDVHLESVVQRTRKLVEDEEPITPEVNAEVHERRSGRICGIQELSSLTFVRLKNYQAELEDLAMRRIEQEQRALEMKIADQEARLLAFYERSRTRDEEYRGARIRCARDENAPQARAVMSLIEQERNAEPLLIAQEQAHLKSLSEERALKVQQYQRLQEGGIRKRLFQN